MKRMLLILLVAAAAWWLWHERPWENLPSFFATDREGWDAPRKVHAREEKTEAPPPTVQHEFIAAIDALCAPLDRSGPEVNGRLMALERRIKQEARQGIIDPAKKDRWILFCAKLRSLQAERVRRRAEYDRLRQSDVHSLRGAQGGRRNREFLVKEYLQSWTRSAREQRSLLMRTIPD
jgi:hypothetical protein